LTTAFIPILLSFLGKTSISAQIAYSTTVLEFLEEKLHKKLDTNVFLSSQTNRQDTQTGACFASDGPYCLHLFGTSLASRLEQTNQKYLDVLAQTKSFYIEMAKRMQASKNMHDSKKHDRNDEFMFRDRSRLL
jgi:hypothetical protein